MAVVWLSRGSHVMLVCRSCGARVALVWALLVALHHACRMVPLRAWAGWDGSAPEASRTLSSIGVAARCSAGARVVNWPVLAAASTLSSNTNMKATANAVVRVNARVAVRAPADGSALVALGPVSPTSREMRRARLASRGEPVTASCVSVSTRSLEDFFRGLPPFSSRSLVERRTLSSPAKTKRGELVAPGRHPWRR